MHYVSFAKTAFQYVGETSGNNIPTLKVDRCMLAESVTMEVLFQPRSSPSMAAEIRKETFEILVALYNCELTWTDAGGGRIHFGAVDEQD